MSEPAPAIRRILATLAAMPTDKRPVSQLTPEKARARTRTIWAEFWSAEPLAVDHVADHVLDTGEGAVPVRYYDPASERRHPIFYFHGGGFVVGDLDTHDAIARRLALYSGHPVISTHYRRAPEHPFPQPLADCVAVIRAVAGGGADLDLDARRFALAGDSAGSNLALGAALRLRGSGIGVAAQALLIGSFDPTLSGPSYARYGAGGYGLTTEDVRWFWSQYLGGNLASPSPEAAPLFSDLRDLPPTLIACAECDPVRDDSLALAERLAAAGVEHEFMLWRGMIHGCLGMARMLNQAEAQMAQVATWLARHL